MKKRSFYLLCGLTILTILLSCNKGKNPVIARVGDQKITTNEFSNFLFVEIGLEKPDSCEQTSRYLSELIDRKLKLIDAYRNELDKNRPIQNRLKFFEEEAVFNFTIEKEVYEKAIPDSLVKSLYQNLSTEVKLHHIYVPINDNNIDSLKNDMENIRQQIQTVEDFYRLAHQFSNDTSTTVDGGNLGYLKWGARNLGERFYALVFKLKKGEISAPVLSLQGLHLILLEDKRDSNILPYEILKYQLRQSYVRLRNDEVSDWMNELVNKAKSNYKIHFHEQNINFLLTKIHEIRKSSQDELVGSQLSQIIPEHDLEKELFHFGRNRFTIENFIYRAGMQNPAGSKHFDTIEDLTEYLKTIVQDREFIVEWGYDKGYHRHKRVAAILQQSKENELIREIEKIRIHHLIEKPSIEKLQDYFEKHLDKYREPKKMKIQAISVHKKILAQQITKRARRMKDFDRLAIQYSEDKKYRAIIDRLGFITEDQFDKVGKKAAQMQIGEVSDPIETPVGFTVIKLLDIKPGKQQAFKKVKSKVELDIRFSMIESLRKQWLNELRKETEIQIYDDALRQLNKFNSKFTDEPKGVIASN